MGRGREKLVTAKQLSVGQKIFGFKRGASHTMFVAYVREVTPSYVFVNVWSPDGVEDRIDSRCLFEVEMTEDEFKAKYHYKAKQIAQSLKNRLTKDRIGYHELMNGWLSHDIYELTAECIASDLYIVGVCYDIIPKTISSLSDPLDVGVCAETPYGERFWCHWRSSAINAMIKQMEEQ